MARLLKMLLAVVVGCVSISILTPTPALADAVSDPRARWIALSDSCTGYWSRQVRTDVVVDPWDWDRPWFYTHSTRDAAGYFRTDIYVKNSFRRADVGRVCKNGHLYRVWYPDRDVHKKKYVNFNCHNLGCAWIGTKRTDWLAGYCVKGVNADGQYYARCD